MDTIQRNLIITLFISLLVTILGGYTMTVFAGEQNDQSKFYTDEGEGVPLIMIHAFPTDQSLWLPQRHMLKNYFRVITLDLPGFGNAVTVDGKAVTMTRYADTVNQLMQQLHIEKAILAGESMGGYVALAFLKKYPNHVSGLILSGTQSVADTEEAKARREASAVDVLEHGTDNFINGFMPKVLSTNASDEVKNYLYDMVKRQAATALASGLRGMALREDTSSVLANTSIPVLIITGEEDALIAPQQSKNMHQLAKNSELVIIPNAGHVVNLEKIDEWNQAVVKMFYGK